MSTVKKDWMAAYLELEQQARAEIREAQNERDQARAEVERLQDGRKDLGKLQILRVLIEQRVETGPQFFMFQHAIRDFCVDVLRKVDAAGEPTPAPIEQ